MKILIAADMEGITGVVNWDQVNPSHAEYARFRRLMTADVNAAALGAFEAGADEVLSVDGHAEGCNILVEELDARVRLISGSPAPLSMMQGVDETVDGVFFVGYHARAGTQNAILDHTWSGAVANVWINSILVGEFGLNAAVAGHFGVPVILVTGDQTACAQTTMLLGDLESAVVKQAVGRFAAECLSPQLAQQEIFTAAMRAVSRLELGDIPDPFIVDLPAQMRIEFVASDMAERAALIPGLRRDGTRVSYQAEEMLSAYATFRAAVDLAG
ncbi:MAG: M55 family metallopeptidase [Chloroflexi bacterium]|nr:M55 family metallopeptidase [Chloroflexota bacterium]